MAARMMLKRRRFSSTIYLGVLKDDQEGMKAHAWIRYGEQILTGAQGHRQFTVVATFGDNSG